MLEEIRTHLTTPRSIKQLSSILESQNWPQESISGLQSCIDELEKNGSVVALADLVDASAKSVETPAASLAYHCIPTKDRPKQLEQHLRSWKGHHQSLGHKLSWIISDDSLVYSSQVRSAALSFARQSGEKVAYLHRSSQEDFIRGLPPALQQSARFALNLDGDTASQAYGSNRNTLLLLSAGDKIAMTDDDIYPVFRRLKLLAGGKNCLSLSSTGRPVHAVSASDWEGLETMGEEIMPEELYGFAGGETVNSFLSGHETLDLSEARFTLIQDALSGKGKVAVLSHPYWGVSGSPSYAFLLYGRNEFSRRYKTDQEYLSCRESALIFRNPVNPHAGYGSLMGGYLLLNPSPVLPPFSPRGRNADGLWGSSLRYLLPSAYTFTPDYAVRHRTAETSGTIDTLMIRPGLNDLIRLLLGFAVRDAGELGQGFKLLSGELQAILQWPAHELEGLFDELVFQALAGRKRLIEQALDNYDSPSSWVADCRAAMAFLDELADEPNFWLPDETADFSALVGYLHNYAELLDSWEELYGFCTTYSKEFLQHQLIT